ncbi:MAG: T9SS type A sorting domain-containing protein [Bacteroidia bacterium]
MIATAQHVYFVSSTDSKIYDTYWDPIALTWTPSSANLGGATCPAVKAGTNIVNYGEDLFFVSAVDSKVYRLRWTPGTGWQAIIVNATQVAVAGNKIFLRTNSSGWEIYYIGTGGKICQIYFDGVTMGTGAQLVAGQTANALTTSPLVVSGSAVYYVCSTDNKIYRVYWGGSSWTGGVTAVVPSSAAVRSSSNIVNETSDLDHLYYVNTSDQICEIVLISGTWTYSVIPSGSNTVIPGTDIVCCYGSIFYVRSSDKTIYRSWKTTGWNSEPTGGTHPVQLNSQIFVWANDIIEEGTINTTFKSYHIFYNSTAPFNTQIQQAIYDDKIVPFAPFGCFDQCDDNHNGTGHDASTAMGNPGPGASTTPYQGYNCALYNDANGIKQKEWHVGAIPVIASGMSALNAITSYNKHFFFVGVDSKLYDFSRTPVNPETQPSHGALNYHDEFTGNHFNSTDWHRKDDAHPSVCNEFWNSPLNANNYLGNMELVAHNIASSNSGSYTFPPDPLPFTRSQSVWVPTGSCLDLLYPDVTADNLATSVNKVYNYSSAFVATDEAGKPKVQFGYLESRLKIPRGKKLWPAYWFYTGVKTEDINFEFPGNGKVLLCTAFHPTLWNAPVIEYAVGYRFYDDFYTYAVNWPDPANGGVYDLKFYHNNELVGSIPNNLYSGQVNCITRHDILYDIGVEDLQANCEPELFPAVFKVDYFRAYNSNISYKTMQNSQPATPGSVFSVFPNPAGSAISITGSGFQRAEIFDMWGNKVITSEKSAISFEELSNGIYLIRIYDTSGGIHANRIIKE